MSTASRVIKLGGSLASSPHLDTLLECISSAHLPMVIVPGGGPFADAVRDIQSLLGFDDAVAHDLALLSMAQYGRVLAARGGFRCASGSAAVSEACLRNSVPIVWLPDPSVDALDVERSWNVSSDSLAVWLANCIGSRRVILVKACHEPVACGWHELANQGIVDAELPRIAATYPAISIEVMYSAMIEKLSLDSSCAGFPDIVCSANVCRG